MRNLILSIYIYIYIYLFICLFIYILTYHIKQVQDETLNRTISSVDIATKENLDNLVKVGEELLDKPVSRVNLDTGILEPTNQGTNREALSRYVTILVVFESSET